MIKMFYNDGHYRLELWEGSTKHPDSVFHMDDFKMADFISSKYQVYQWILECASRLTFPFHAKELVDYANKHWYNW